MKKALRQEIRGRLARLSPSDVQTMSAKACDLLVAQPEYKRAEIIMVFLAHPTEVDTKPLVLRAWQDRKRILAPKVSWEQRRMLPVEIRSLTEDLTTTPVGVREPTTGPPYPISLIDLVIVPGLGFDEHGNRLGRGRGFYDRFLAHPEFQGVSCAMAFEMQMTELVPSDALDVRVKMLVTEVKVRRFAPHA